MTNVVPINNSTASMNAAQIFENSDFGSLEVIMIDGKPHFPATDCAKILGYIKPHNAIAQHCRYSLKWRVPHPQNASKTIERNYIPEGDLYRLIISSKLPSAERFERWVMDEVLPAIRKDGMYMSESQMRFIRFAYQELLDIIDEFRDELKRHRQGATEIKVIEDSNIQIAEMVVLMNRHGIPCERLQFFRWLRENGYLESGGENYNLPTITADTLQLFEVDEKTWVNHDTGEVRVHRKSLVTPLGQKYFISKFLNHTAAAGVLACCSTDI